MLGEEDSRQECVQRPRAGGEFGTSESGKEEQCGWGIVSNGSVEREEAGEGRGLDPRALSTRVRSLGFILSTS